METVVRPPTGRKRWKRVIWNTFLVIALVALGIVFPSYPKDAPTIVRAYNNVQIAVEKAFASAVLSPEFNGSNNWVVSGEKTKSGKPLLANDPHLSLNTPSIWYQMHLQAPTVNVSGVIFAGVPGIILGHNEHVAWGVTNTGPDVQDLYIEKRNPNNKHQFLYNGKWEDATLVKEPIKVKGGKTIPYEVMITRHGPVISDFAYKSNENMVFSLRWTALDPSTELQAIADSCRRQPSDGAGGELHRRRDCQPRRFLEVCHRYKRYQAWLPYCRAWPGGAFPQPLVSRSNR